MVQFDKTLTLRLSILSRGKGPAISDFAWQRGEGVRQNIYIYIYIYIVVHILLIFDKTKIVT